MIFGFVEGNDTIICGHTENKNKFESFKEIDFSSDPNVLDADDMDFLTQARDKNYKNFSEVLFVVSHKSKYEQSNFIANHNIEIYSIFDCEEMQEKMVRNFEEIKRRDENNRIRKEAFEKGEIPKNTIGDLYYKDGIDPYDKRTDEQKEKDAEKLKERNEKILKDIADGTNKIPILTNLDKEDRDAQDMSHLRREKLQKMMEDFDEENDMVDVNELRAVMEYEQKVFKAKTQEEKDELKEELYSKLSEKTIKAREEKEKEISDSQKEVKKQRDMDFLEKEKEKYKNGEVNSDTKAIDRDIFIDIDSDEISETMKKIIGLVNQKCETIKVVDLPLTSIVENKISLPSNGFIFEKEKHSLVHVENLEHISTIEVFGMKSNNYKIVDNTKDVMVLYCDNSFDENNNPKQTPCLVRLKLSD